MLPYILTFFLMSLFSVRSYLTDRKNKAIFLVVTLFLGALAGSRVETLGGYDTGVYKLMYDNLKGYNDVSSPDYFLLQTTERGYIFLMAFLKSFGLNFNYFLLILGLSCGLALYYVFSRYIKYPIIVFAIFLSKGYLYYFFTAQRQIIAMCLCWLALNFVIKRKFIPFAAMILAAALVHSSAIVFLIVYFLYNLKVNNIQAIALIVTSVLFGLLGIGSLLGNLVSAFLPFGGEKLNSYLSGADGGINVLNFLELLPILFFVMTNREIIAKKTPHYQFFFNVYLIFLLITFAFYDFAFIARLKGYFIIGYIVVIASLVDITKKKQIGIGILMAILLYCFAVMVRELLVFDDGTGYLPYKSFLF